MESNFRSDYIVAGLSALAVLIALREALALSLFPQGLHFAVSYAIAALASLLSTLLVAAFFCKGKLSIMKVFTVYFGILAVCGGLGLAFSSMVDESYSFMFNIVAVCLLIVSGFDLPFSESVMAAAARYVLNLILLWASGVSLSYAVWI